MKKRRLTLLGSLLCVLALTACTVTNNIEGDVNVNVDTNIDTGDDNTQKETPTEITLTLTVEPDSAVVTVGDSVTLFASVSPSTATVTYSSSDTSVATVNNSGVVTTLSAGTVTITATASLEGYTTKTASITITVNPVSTGGDSGGDSGSGRGGNEGNEPSGGTEDVTTYGVEITNGANLTPLEIGDTKTVSVSLITYVNEVETSRQDATNEVTLGSTKQGVLSINGLEITAASAGTTTLTATWGEKVVTSSGVSITVNVASGGDSGTTPDPEPEPSTVVVSFNSTSYTVEEESTVQTSLTTDPTGASVTYESSDTNVATVNASGLVTGVKAGEATITATASYTGYNAGTATCSITVTEKVVEEPEPTESGYYVLYGDFVDADWDDFPNPGDDTYLGYTSDDTKYWEVTITTTEAPDFGSWDPWNATFRIIYAYYDPTGGDDGTGANVYETIADYYALDTTNSTGTLGVNYDSEGNANICLHWDTTYTITIDLTDSSNPYILVVMDTTGVTYDSCYVLYGDFVESYWKESPEEDSDFYLAYNSTDTSTKHWEIRATTTSEPTDNEYWSDENQWDAGFRIIAYGDDSTTILNYSSLATGSTGVLGTNSDNNICIKWNATYDIVIDMTGDTASILVTLVTESGGDTGSSGGSEVSYDSKYALVGDFPGYDWDESPDTDSIYYLPYSSTDKSTMYWERTITIADPPVNDQYWENPDTWDAGFRVVEYGTWNTVVGYSNITGTPTGVNGTDNNDDIEVDFGATFDLVIDCTGSTNTITVTLVEEEETYNIDGHYILYGDFDGMSWSTEPGYDSIYDLPYDSTNSNSKYWTRTITTGNPTWTTGFRIVEYGSETNVAGYSNFTIDSASTGLYSGGADNNNNIRFAAANTSYDLTIDMRGSTWTLLVNYHSDDFEAGINGKAGGTSSGGSSSGTYGDDLGITSSYAMGMDTSSIVEVLEAGAVMYDYDGNKIDDIDEFMSFVASEGVNYIRIRLWLNPYDGSGNSYGGGHNDESTDLTIAKAAVKAGMKICLDFHYSDFWADRERQFCPDEWSSLSGSTLNSTAAEYTTSILTDFRNANCTPSMVQVGNETNNNSICGTSGTDFFVACCAAVNSFDSSIKVVIHYADDQTTSVMKTYFKALVDASCQFDIIGLSFYPFWHRNGSISTFQSDMEDFKSELSKDVCLMEYSYGFTTTWTDWGDTYGQMSNTFNDTLQAVAGYEASPEGQAQCIYDINKAVVDAGGIGSFYWESAWISKKGTCWASSYSAEFYTNHGVSVTDWAFDTCSWANQALFDYDGYVLSSFNIYNQMWGN